MTGTFSVWHWLDVLATLVAIGAIALALVRRSSRPAGRAVVAGPVGFGGWFVVPLIGQTLAPLVRVMAIVSTAQALPALAGTVNGPLVAWGEIALETALAGYALWVTVAMYRRSPRFPRLFMWQWIALLCFAAFEPALVAVLVGLPLASIYDERTIAGIGGTLIGGLWVWYMLRSIRVRNTFRAGETVDVATFD